MQGSCLLQFSVWYVTEIWSWRRTRADCKIQSLRIAFPMSSLCVNYLVCVFKVAIVTCLVTTCAVSKQISVKRVSKLQK